MGKVNKDALRSHYNVNGIHPDKTFVGRISRGFSFLGIHFTPRGCRLADAG
ncbi:MAG: hypothetical protein RI601_10320 [Desulfurivibrionaceae bacterium]|nr:hypothetical protein [Desulfurivibrionaceae bacterium]